MGQAKNRRAEIAQLKASNTIVLGQLHKAMIGLSIQLLDHNPNQGYTQTDASVNAAKIAIEHYKFNGQHFNQILKAREDWNQQLTLKFGVNMLFGAGAFGQDIEGDLVKSGAPKELIVATGLYDTLVTIMGIRCGAIKFA